MLKVSVTVEGPPRRGKCDSQRKIMERTRGQPLPSLVEPVPVP